MIRRLILTLCLLFSLALSGTANAQAPERYALPAPICALSAARLVCYDVRTASPRFITPPEDRVIAFALSPAADAALYRTEDGQIAIVGLDDPRPILIAENISLPALLPHDSHSLAWAPDGVALAYLTAEGLQIALPTPNGAPLILSETARQYVNLRFSPFGGRLAAQDHLGGWTVFTLVTEDGIRRGLARIGSFDEPSDAAWLDDNSLILAPISGGLLRLNVIETAEQAFLTEAWRTREGAFTRLTSAYDGTVRAMQRVGMTPEGTLVSIGGDGTATPFGERRVDIAMRWLGNGSRLAYITSGTPIVVIPESGVEDALPLQRVQALDWAMPIYQRVSNLALDADLYFLAFDGIDNLDSYRIQESGVPQVWRLLGSGERAAEQLSRLSEGVRAFALSPDRRQMAVVSGQAVAILPALNAAELAAAATATPAFRRGTPTPVPLSLPNVPESRLVAQLRTTTLSSVDWSADGRLIAFVDTDGAYIVEALNDSVTLPQPLTVAASTLDRTYDFVRFSADGRSLLLGATLSDGSREFAVAPLSENGWRLLNFRAEVATWGLNALFTVRREGDQWLLSAYDGQSETILARSAYPITAVQPIGAAARLAEQQVVFWRQVGWSVAAAVQRVSTTGNPEVVRVESPPFPLPNAQFSPTARFAVGQVRGRNAKIDQLIILDTTNGRAVALRNVRALDHLQWMR
ncbi:MAG: hypothetical protein CUN51_01545 [Candidatus Thermofonsia Clade 1 bacterium]|uniref:Lipoprotein LpqB beta-propeller domain-containing protein n=1 Tax=Candidatus Thermofonsia Clade 1 bacterium TaxID=2364210 RepID=A0A2M8P463_9CHLR|nr:MAG: hypothetical protein CUN51_01545 [Candidatus Thermofonsia Clade 1 bacterium]